MKSYLDITPLRRARRIATAACCLAGLLAAAPAAEAGSILPALTEAGRRPGCVTGDISKHYVLVDDGVRMAVKGRRERRQVRYARLRQLWSADQRQAAATYGFPVNRLRELAAGVLTESWSYPEARVRLTFDASGRLIEAR